MTHYARGAAWERQLQAMLESKGWQTYRSAGSHTKVDVIAARIGRRLAIQCKTGKAKMSRKDMLALCEAARALYATPVIASRSREKGRTYQLVSITMRESLAYASSHAVFTGAKLPKLSSHLEAVKEEWFD